MIKRIVSIAVLAGILLLGITQKEGLLAIVNEGGTYAVLVSMLLVAICVFVPIVPFPVLAGLIGGIFGTAEGVLVTLSGSMIGTMLFFYIARYGFKEWAQAKLDRYPQVKDYEDKLHKNAFLAILLVRLVPVVPSPVVNIVCGLSRVNGFVFLIASAIGKLPNILLLSFAGASFAENKWFSFGLYGVYVLIIMAVNYVIVYKRMNKVPE
ncbi:VTT domain-containing protein [Domibacillus sp. DTU_2020_1001157_1_SI_ALB_TIR_016]|uniref:TVP38/TMEM64 family protein n=1 Tax=Domibacillus sp. DTU_2020_1001157_1_SI_ALB_TIR_016 TaxID=3077789 RepID=UPI0028ED8C7E|nr:VTT domain-containing protein [Domibacillus sp. DTU_2020_1001157_1_SI_ALB_TIR_016]WNS79991.1 VTT domain-containing protein [Domibacillus sp. DTU_2020_1001157_1_SI_ALB_TIR_016]